MTTAIVSRVVPPARGSHKLVYRLYTVAHLPFPALAIEGGPKLVTVGGWRVDYLLKQAPPSGMYGRGHATVESVTLAVVRGGILRTRRHQLDGTVVGSVAEAHRVAYDEGLLAWMVYDRDAERFGLPKPQC